MYRSEGRFLMKLINRETDMTIYEISEKYRGGLAAQSFKLMAKIWEQDLNIKFDPSSGEDKMAEQIIRDIQAGLIPFNDEVITVDKLAFKASQSAYKDQLKKNKKVTKAREKAIRKKKRKAHKLKD